MAITVTIDSGHGWRLLLRPVGNRNPTPMMVAEIDKPRLGWVRAYGDDEPAAEAVSQLLKDTADAVFDQLAVWLSSNPEDERPVAPAAHWYSRTEGTTDGK